MLAAISACIAAGFQATAVKISLAIVFVLFGVDLLEDYSQALTRGVHRKYQGWKGRGGKGSDA